MSNYLKVWCEFDINGDFGGNNNEEVIIVDDSIMSDEVETRVLKWLVKVTGLREEDLEGLWGWCYIKPTEMTFKEGNL